MMLEPEVKEMARISPTLHRFVLSSSFCRPVGIDCTTSRMLKRPSSPRSSEVALFAEKSLSQHTECRIFWKVL